MNNLWQMERMVELKLQEINREIAYDRLVKEACVSGPNLLARAVGALHNLVRARQKAVQDHASIEHGSYQSLGD